MANKPLVIGLTGAFGSGKTTAANFFEQQGFRKIILSSFLSEILSREGKMLTRKNFQDLGNKLRKANGPDFLAQKSLDVIKKENIEKATVDGIRNVWEVQFLKKNSRFVLIGVVADRYIRFERVKRMKGREELSLEEFEALDRRDLGLTDESSSGLQVAKCLALSDYFVESNDEEAYPRKLEEVLKRL